MNAQNGLTLILDKYVDTKVTRGEDIDDNLCTQHGQICIFGSPLNHRYPIARLKSHELLGYSCFRPSPPPSSPSSILP